jgi:O-antigen/teichoic acid export membrane protein
METKGFTPARVLARNTLFNLVGMVSPLVVGIIAIPFAIKSLGTDGFGILSITWVLLGYLALLDFGLSRATTKFVAEYFARKDLTALGAVIWTAVGAGFFLGVAGGTGIYLLAPYAVRHLLAVPDYLVTEAITAFRFLAWALPFILVTTSLKGVLGAAQRFDWVNLVHVPVSAMNFLIPALSRPLHLSLSGVIIAIVIVRVAASGVYFLLCSRQFPSIRTRPRFRRGVLERLFRYGGWITVSGVISPLLVYMDRFLIGSFLSMEAVTYYSAPYEVISRMRIIPLAVMMTFFPEFSAIAGKHKERTDMLFGRSVKYVFVVTGAAAILLFYFAPEILGIWLGEDFVRESTLLFRLFLAGIVFNCLASIPFTLFQGAGRPDIPAKFHLLEFPLYLGVLWVMISRYQVAGAAIAWFVRVFVDFLLLFGRTMRTDRNLIATLNRYGVFRSGAVLAGLGVGVFVISRLTFIPAVETVLVFAAFGVAGVLFWRIGMDAREREWILSVVLSRIRSPAGAGSGKQDV